MSFKGFAEQTSKYLFKAEQPELNDYLNRYVFIDDEKIQIKHITGNIWFPKYLEINGRYRISMLRFFKQMNNDKSITEEQLQAFEDMDVSARKLTAEEQIHKEVNNEKAKPNIQ